MIIGDYGVGKTRLLVRFAENTFNETLNAQVDFKISTISLGATTVKLQVWDTAQTEKFTKPNSSYYRGAHGVLVVYDINKRETFQNVPGWLKEIEKFACEDVHKMVVGCKSDVGKREVSEEEARKYAEEAGLELLETSSKSGANVKEVFSKMAQAIVDKVAQKDEE
uniref:Uncharacterized protein n=1 Tax=Arcella intermedia TaxID=1963864 RepID=A0A6B2LLM3_9EUKA